MRADSSKFYCARYFDGRYLSVSGGLSSFYNAWRFSSLPELRCVVGHDVCSGHCTIEEFSFSEVPNGN